MKRIRKFLQATLFITFFVGLAEGMTAGNIIAILLNGLIVVALIANEDEE